MVVKEKVKQPKILRSVCGVSVWACRGARRSCRTASQRGLCIRGWPHPIVLSSQDFSPLGASSPPRVVMSAAGINAPVKLNHFHMEMNASVRLSVTTSTLWSLRNPRSRALACGSQTAKCPVYSHLKRSGTSRLYLPTNQNNSENQTRIYSVSCPEHSFRQEHHAKVEDTQRRSQALS
jgi:hypothetical protein